MVESAGSLAASDAHLSNSATVQLSDAPMLLPVPPLLSPFFKEQSELLSADALLYGHDHLRQHPEQPQEQELEEDAERAQPSSEATLLQQQLSAAARRLSTSIDAQTGRPRAASLRSPLSPPIRPTLATRHSSFTQRDGQMALNGHQAVLDKPISIKTDLPVNRQRSSTPPPTRSREPSTATERASPSTLSIPSPTTPTGSSSSSSPKRTSPRALLAPLKALRRLSVQASPSPPTPGMTRSHSSPPFLPSLTPTAPLSPLNLTFTPPTAGIAPSTQTQWPTLEQSAPYQQAAFSLSAPDLISTVVPEAAIPQEPLDAMAQEAQDSPLDLGAVFREVQDYSLHAREDKRYHALLELVETETAYRDTLRTLVKVSLSRSNRCSSSSLTLVFDRCTSRHSLSFPCYPRATSRL